MSTVAESTATVQFDAAWTSAVTRVSAMAQAKLPESLHGRIQRATALVLHGAVWLEDDGHTCQVRSSDENLARWYATNGACTCVDYERAPEGYCKHRLGRAIYLRASELLREPVTLDLDEPEIPAPYMKNHVPAQHVVQIQGKSFIKFAGLLQMAHEKGLQDLQADWTYNDAGLSLAHAVAVFPFGRFEESGDATPDNVTKKVAPHFRRVALTRAKSRALRDALGLDLLAVEELGELDHD